MNIYLKIYLLGCLTTFIECILIAKDENDNITLVELIVSIFCSIFSWLLALPLFIGMNFGNKNNSKKDKDDNNNLAGGTA
jgi:hypothetical protein